MEQDCEMSLEIVVWIVPESHKKNATKLQNNLKYKFHMHGKFAVENSSTSRSCVKLLCDSSRNGISLGGDWVLSHCHGPATKISIVTSLSVTCVVYGEEWEVRSDLSAVGMPARVPNGSCVLNNHGYFLKVGLARVKIAGGSRNEEVIEDVVPHCHFIVPSWSSIQLFQIELMLAHVQLLIIIFRVSYLRKNDYTVCRFNGAVQWIK